MNLKKLKKGIQREKMDMTMPDHYDKYNNVLNEKKYFIKAKEGEKKRKKEEIQLFEDSKKIKKMYRRNQKSIPNLKVDQIPLKYALMKKEFPGGRSDVITKILAKKPMTFFEPITFSRPDISEIERDKDGNFILETWHEEDRPIKIVVEGLINSCPQ